MFSITKVFILGDMECNVVSYVDIEGNKSTDFNSKTVISNENAKLAYILNESNETIGLAQGNGPVQNAIWQYFGEWISIVGKDHYYTVDGNAKEIGLNNIMQVTGFNGNGDSVTDHVTAHRNDSTHNKENCKYCKAYKILEDATNYASTYKEEDYTNIKDNTNKDNIIKNLKSYETADGTTYIKMGPFNWTFSGTMQSIEVERQNGEKVNGEILFSEYRGDKEYNLGVEEIKSDSDFYISIPESPESYDIEKITKITAHTKQKVKSVRIWFLDNQGPYQNFIRVEPYEREEEFSTPFEYDIQLRVKLSGFVWKDLFHNDKTDSPMAGSRNDIFKEGEGDEDELLNGVIVRLKDKNTGDVINTTITGELGRYVEEYGQDRHTGNGEYIFEKVFIGDLDKYYIEFEYDGLTYTDVKTHLDINNGSKAKEATARRNEFNKGFATVEGKGQMNLNNNTSSGITRDDKGNITHELSYRVEYDNDRERSVATLEKIDENGNPKYAMIADTNEAEYNLLEHYQGGDEIRNINLGLTERIMPSIGIEKDIQNVRLSINNYQHIYEYAQRNNEKTKEENEYNVGVQFGIKGTKKYTRPIYQSDLDYEKPAGATDINNELEVYITYKLTMNIKDNIDNKENIELTATINSIDDYFDSRYELMKVGTTLNDKKEVVEGIKYVVDEYDNQFKKAIIYNNTEVGKDKQSEIYVEFKLDKDAVLKIINGNETLDNVSEINSYSIKDESNNIYATIDRESAPGDVIPGEENTKIYQHDTDHCQALKLTISDNARQMTGKVFLDETTGELSVGKIREGDGKYSNGEQGIGGVEVKLKEITGSGKEYTTTTDENGEFIIEGFIPGDYTLTYTWGDETYTVQNYKGTIYDEERYNTNKDDKEWYKKDVETRYTDAIDDYKKREDIDKEMERLENGSKFENTKMDSTTPTMGIGVEYETTTTASYGDQYTYEIKNIDFGIVERARQALEIKKRVSTMKVTLANSQVIADFEIDENGKIEGKRSNVTYMRPSDSTTPKNGLLRLELDKEMIQGATLNVGYSIQAINNSELDYNDEAYYKYGTTMTGTPKNIVTIAPSEIIDYLDKEWSLDNEKNGDTWTLQTINDIKDKVADTVTNVDSGSTIEDKLILSTEELYEKQIEPGKYEEVKLNVSKLLSNTDEISLDNETECINVAKTGGANIQSIPGNYVPGSGHQEMDDSMAETIIVTDSTGDNRNYIITIVAITSALLILGTGIVLIKKKALK